MPHLPQGSTLCMIGGTRGLEDTTHLNRLKQMAIDFNLGQSVRFIVNEPREVLIDYFRKAKVGLHTMEDEHFGIAIVEMMSAGLVTVAHASGGPLHDIIGNQEEQIGFLASST